MSFLFQQIHTVHPGLQKHSPVVGLQEPPFWHLHSDLHSSPCFPGGHKLSQLRKKFKDWIFTIIIRICIRNTTTRSSQRSCVARGTMAFARDVMAASTVSAATLFPAILSISVRRACLITMNTSPSSGAHTFAIEWVTDGFILAHAILFTRFAPFSSWTHCRNANILKRWIQFFWFFL